MMIYWLVVSSHSKNDDSMSQNLADSPSISGLSSISNNIPIVTFPTIDETHGISLIYWNMIHDIQEYMEYIQQYIQYMIIIHHFLPPRSSHLQPGERGDGTHPFRGRAVALHRFTPEAVPWKTGGKAVGKP